jgi:hypothetical protein
MTALRKIGLLVVIAALPVPLLLYVGIVAREGLVWIFVADLVVALLAVRVASSPGSVKPANDGRWSFDRAPPG